MDTLIDLRQAVPWLRAYAGQTFVVKVGGELLQQDRWRDAIAADLATLHRLGIRVVLVHGGGPQLDDAARRLDLPSERVAGRRVTTPALLDTAIGVWRGQLSLAWVSALAAQGEDAVGLSGADGGLIQAARRPPAVVIDDAGEHLSVDYGCVGDVQAVRPAALQALLALPVIPVVAPLARGTGAEVLNVNADTVAAELAIALSAAKLLLLTSAPGVLADPDDPDSVLATLSAQDLAELADTPAIRGGMRPKVSAMLRALQGGVARVHVVDGRLPGVLLQEVFTSAGAGTLVIA